MLLLLLLLLDPKNSAVKAYFDLYFVGLKRAYLREDFLENYKGALIKETIEKLTQLFIDEPFGSEKIKNHIKKTFYYQPENEPEILNLITNYQKEFYSSILEEFELENDEITYKKILASGNPSFKLLSKHDDDKLTELLFIHHYYNQHREIISEEEREKVQLSRLLTTVDIIRDEINTKNSDIK